MENFKHTQKEGGEGSNELSAATINQYLMQCLIS